MSSYVSDNNTILSHRQQKPNWSTLIKLPRQYNHFCLFFCCFFQSKMLVFKNDTQQHIHPSLPSHYRLYLHLHLISSSTREFHLHLHLHHVISISITWSLSPSPSLHLSISISILISISDDADHSRIAVMDGVHGWVFPGGHVRLIRRQTFFRHYRNFEILKFWQNANLKTREFFVWHAVQRSATSSISIKTKENLNIKCLLSYICITGVCVSSPFFTSPIYF